MFSMENQPLHASSKDIDLSGLPPLIHFAELARPIQRPSNSLAKLPSQKNSERGPILTPVISETNLYTRSSTVLPNQASRVVHSVYTPSPFLTPNSLSNQNIEVQPSTYKDFTTYLPLSPLSLSSELNLNIPLNESYQIQSNYIPTATRSQATWDASPYQTSQFQCQDLNQISLSNAYNFYSNQTYQTNPADFSYQSNQIRQERSLTSNAATQINVVPRLPNSNSNHIRQTQPEPVKDILQQYNHQSHLYTNQGYYRQAANVNQEYSCHSSFSKRARLYEKSSSPGEHFVSEPSRAVSGTNDLEIVIDLTLDELENKPTNLNSPHTVNLNQTDIRQKRDLEGKPKIFLSSSNSPALSNASTEIYHDAFTTGLDTLTDKTAEINCRKQSLLNLRNNLIQNAIKIDSLINRYILLEKPLYYPSVNNTKQIFAVKDNGHSDNHLTTVTAEALHNTFEKRKESPFEKNMYPMTMDQSRQENVPAQHTLQVHMHHLCCPCSNVIYPYYPPGYRPPLLAQPPPIPRPSYLHHYQYTQLHVNPAYNVPLHPPMAQHLPQTMTHSPPSTVDLAFGPPPRDRRNLDSQDYDEQRQISDKNKSENRNSLLQYTPLPLDNVYGSATFTENLQDNFKNLTAAQVASLSTENYIKYLDNGCFIGETIAKRNEQRPCFKNIQNLCNRTRSEVMKPNITVSNIHSQGVPWATKDFIFAFVRAINCWCILRGYLGCKDGNLGKIDREISPEFRACYAKWEKCTKQLTHYLIQTFYKLDEANLSPNLNASNLQSHSNPGPSTSAPTATLINRPRNPSPPQETSRKTVPVMIETTTQTVERKLSNKEMAALKGIPGILHIPPTTSAEIGEVRNPNSESTEISPRDEDSDSESRVYMKPGSYNVPTKQQSSQSNTNSPRSIEFFDTAQNVSAHHRKVINDKSESYTSEVLRDKVWQTAQNVTPEFIKQNEESSSSIGEKLYDMAVQQNKHIESWLNNEMNIFDCAVHDAEDETIPQTEDLLQPSVSGKTGKANDAVVSRCNDLEAASRMYKNRPAPRSYSTFRRNLANAWEYKTGGLTETAITLVDRILKELERTDFALHVNLKIPYSRSDESEIKNPTDLTTISKKLKNKTHACLNEVIHDFRHIISCSSEFFTDSKILKQLGSFRDKFEEMINHTFPNVDFNQITGEPNEALGPVIIRQRGRPTRKITEGDGDH